MVGLYFLSRGSDRIGAVQKTLEALIIPLMVVGTVLNPQTWLGRLLELAPVRYGLIDVPKTAHTVLHELVARAI